MSRYPSYHTGESRYPHDHAIRTTTLYAVARPLGRVPARQSKCDDGAPLPFLLSCPEMPAPRGTLTLAGAAPLRYSAGREPRLWP